MRYKTLAAILLIAMISPAAHGSDKDECVGGDRVIKRQLAGFNLTVSRYHDPTLPSEIEECRAIVRDQQKHVVFSAHDFALTLAVAGQDVNGDGVPDLVFEAYAGGAHGDYTYYIVSLGGRPGLLLKLETESVRAAFNKRQGSGHVEIHTWDGAFFMFDGTSNAFTPYPEVYLQIDGVKLRNTSTQHKADYDKAIRKIEASLPSADFARLRAIDEHWSKVNEEEAASAVLNIVLAYLYGGRQASAHSALRRMWPPFDQERIWKLILATRRKGVLKQAAE